MTIEASWCFLLARLLTPPRLLTGPGSLWRSSSGTGAREPDCLSQTAVSPVVAAASAVAVAVAVAAVAVVAVAVAADFGATSADCR